MHEEGTALITSAAALTEFLGGSPRELRSAGDWVASLFRIESVDEGLARRAATLMRGALDAAPAASPGPIDALVAAEAERRQGKVVIAGDRADFAALAAASGRFEVIDLEALIAGR